MKYYIFLFSWGEWRNWVFYQYCLSGGKHWTFLLKSVKAFSCSKDLWCAEPCSSLMKCQAQNRMRPIEWLEQSFWVVALSWGCDSRTLDEKLLHQPAVWCRPCSVISNFHLYLEIHAALSGHSSVVWKNQRSNRWTGTKNNFKTTGAACWLLVCPLWNAILCGIWRTSSKSQYPFGMLVKEQEWNKRKDSNVYNSLVP